jgi:aspartate/methionine/tyrosine aminotransferase
MLKTIAAFDRIGEENAFAVLARANALAAQGRDIISLGIGQPDFRTPDHIVEAAVKALREGHHGYTAANGIPPLREAVAADLHKRYGVEVSPDSVMIMPGGKPTMFMSILMFGEPGAEIMYPDPGFPIYRSMIEFTGATPIPVPIRFCLFRRRDAEADHAEDASPHRQLAGQSDRRRHAQERSRQTDCRLGEVARRRHHVGRDLRPHDL